MISTRNNCQLAIVNHTHKTIRLINSARPDPDKFSLSGSGLPIPSKSVRSDSAISLLIRLNVFLS